MNSKKTFFLTAFLTLGFMAAKAQEVLSPIGWRYELNKDVMSTKIGNTIDGLFVYNIDTISLPIIDDFSSNKFQQYPSDPSAPDVQSETFFALLDLSNQVLPSNSVFTTIKTYRIDITLQPVITRDTTWFVSTQVNFNNLQNYPVVYEQIEVYPRYILIDTLDLQKPAPDTLWINANLRTQDSATVYKVDINDPDSYWVDNTAHWNFTRAHLPRSLGVVTFDGVDETGWPYAINTGMSGYADYLTSKPLIMNFPPSAGVYLTFLYQPQGLGDVPEPSDSLIVEFFNVLEQKWEWAWSVSGSPVHDFKTVHLPITEIKYLQNGFRFRFKNYGGLSGDIDNWHIDFVRLQTNVNESDTILLDFAAVYPITSLLKTYTAVPWEHYRSNPSGHMNDNLSITVRNNNIIAGNTQNAVLRIFDEGIQDHEYIFPGATLTTDLNFNPQTTYTTNHNLNTLGPNYNLPATSPNDTSYCFDYYFRAGVPFPQTPQYIHNDTIKGKQCFSNFYSYDDGSAEQAYGINGEQARLAYQFTTLTNEPQTLVAVQMHFVPTVFDHSNKLFLLTVWGDNNGQPGQILYQDDFFTAQSPVYIGEKNSYWHYYFRDMSTVEVQGTFYVGWRQLDPERLNVGFDRNTNTQNKIFFSTDLGASWQNSSFQGSLMIRPVFSSKLDYMLDLEDITPEELSLFPNPFDQEINFNFAKDGSVAFYTSDGKLIKSTNWESNISTSDLNSGFYFVHVYSHSGDFQKIFKIIKK